MFHKKINQDIPTVFTLENRNQIFAPIGIKVVENKPSFYAIRDSLLKGTSAGWGKKSVSYLGNDTLLVAIDNLIFIVNKYYQYGVFFLQICSKRLKFCYNLVYLTLWTPRGICITHLIGK